MHSCIYFQFKNGGPLISKQSWINRISRRTPIGETRMKSARSIPAMYERALLARAGFAKFSC